MLHTHTHTQSQHATQQCVQLHALFAVAFLSGSRPDKNTANSFPNISKENIIPTHTITTAHDTARTARTPSPRPDKKHHKPLSQYVERKQKPLLITANGVSQTRQACDTLETKTPQTYFLIFPKKQTSQLIWSKVFANARVGQNVFKITRIGCKRTITFQNALGC